jgi:hypothetical protein
VPLFDIAFVGIGRIVTGKVHSLTEWLAYTGRDHIHHRFEQLGLTKRESVLLIFFLASTLGLSALLLKAATPREAVLIWFKRRVSWPSWRCWRASGVGDRDPEPCAVFLGSGVPAVCGMMNA